LAAPPAFRQRVNYNRTISRGRNHALAVFVGFLTAAEARASAHAARKTNP